ncbi:MAG TPA: hypothetical protein VI698_04740 [Nitrososphaerales archaeon]|nr:hypothetical protein [Nitrososphaerales archaeon]
MRAVTYTIVIGASVLAVFVIAVSVSQQSQTLEKPVQVPTGEKQAFELGMYGKTFLHADAERVLGYKIKLPAYLPADNDLRMIKVDEKSKWSVGIYSPVSVDDSTEETELMQNNGFIIINSPAPEVTDIDVEIQRLIENGGKEIPMQRVKGVGLTDVPLMPGYSEIHWWEDGLHHIVGGSFGFAELSKIVESM